MWYVHTPAYVCTILHEAVLALATGCGCICNYSMLRDRALPEPLSSPVHALPTGQSHRAWGAHAPGSTVAMRVLALAQ